MLAERAARANRATRGALAANLCFEALVVLLVPRTLARTSYGLGAGRASVLIAFAVVLVIVGFLQRRTWGIAVGSVLQLPLMATAIWIPIFAVIAAIFWGIWLYILTIRHDLVGTPGGLRMFVS
jgi:hypothetical protein